MSRYTRDGGPQLDALITEQLNAIADDVWASIGDRAICLGLGGGYGRGEGGVRITASGSRPYNDYDLVLLHRYDGVDINEHCRNWHSKYSQRCGVHVDITPIHTKRLLTLPQTLTWYEFGQGHQVVGGDPGAFTSLTKRSIADIHPSEWGRLLVNRGCGLYFARLVLSGNRCMISDGEDETAFVHRQCEKAWLAAGDVILADHDRYHHLVLQRAKAMASLGTKPDWVDRWFQAVEFKLNPRNPPHLDNLSRDLSMAQSVLLPLLIQHPAARQDQWHIGCYATMRFMPPSFWLKSKPWIYPRERLRSGLTKVFAGHDPRRYWKDDTTMHEFWQRWG